MTQSEPAHIEVEDLTLGYGANIVQRHLSFKVERGEVFVIVGGSGCGKSTVMRGLVGLVQPKAGTVRYSGENLWEGSAEARERIRRRLGVMYQNGALWSSQTLVENVSLPLELYTKLKPTQVEEIAAFKLALVGLRGFESYYPSEISGGMRKRVGVARAMALDPEILFFDEPSAGLDPLSSRRMDDLILQLKEELNTTMVVVSHELASIFAIGTNCIFLDAQTKTMIATGNPQRLRDDSKDLRVRSFLNRGEA